MVKELIDQLNKYASPERKKTNEWFFKTGEGQYGAHDKFIGIRVPDIRKTIKKHTHLPLKEIQSLLDHQIHEYRLAALLILVHQYKRSGHIVRSEIYQFYLKHKQHVNNWDLVDSSASTIVGGYLYDYIDDIDILYELADSPVIWDRRIAIIATLYFVKRNRVDIMLKLSQRLLKDKEDLIHKAIGWMLREGWKVAPETIEYFLMNHYNEMPRTTLRYAIERIEENKRKAFLKGNFET